MAINWFTAFVLYVMIWWTVLFVVLPIGTRPVADADRATGWRGAPDQSRIGRKAIWTTLISAIVWGVILLVQARGWISFRSGWLDAPGF